MPLLKFTASSIHFWDAFNTTAVNHCPQIFVSVAAATLLTTECTCGKCDDEDWDPFNGHVKSNNNVEHILVPKGFRCCGAWYLHVVFFLICFSPGQQQERERHKAESVVA